MEYPPGHDQQKGPLQWQLISLLALFLSIISSLPPHPSSLLYILPILLSILSTLFSLFPRPRWHTALLVLGKKYQNI